MTQHTDKELDLQAADPAAAAVAPTEAERRDDAGVATPVEATDLSKSSEEAIETTCSSDGIPDEKAVRPTLAQTRTHATEISMAPSTGTVEKPQRPWYKKLNPLRWGAIPPIPTEPIVSREANAGFWSKLTFTWMGPLMTISQNISSLSLSAR